MPRPHRPRAIGQEVLSLAREATDLREVYELKARVDGLQEQVRILESRLEHALQYHATHGDGIALVAGCDEVVLPRVRHR